MSNSVKKYGKIINRLIKKSFPSLKEKKIHIEEKSKMPFSANVDRPFFTDYLKIKVHPRLRNYSLKSLKAVFVHELCHLEYFIKIGKIRLIIRELKLFLSKNAIIEDEKRTDKQAIKKGYGKELYEQRKLRFKSKDKELKKLRKLYLTPNYIKEYAKSIKKW